MEEKLDTQTNNGENDVQTKDVQDGKWTNTMFS